LYRVSYGEDVTGNLPDGYWHRIDADHRELMASLTHQDAEAAATQARFHLDYVASVAKL
jgi:DNA-binding FadR family transcriptional regulator